MRNGPPGTALLTAASRPSATFGTRSPPPNPVPDWLFATKRRSHFPEIGVGPFFRAVERNAGLGRYERSRALSLRPCVVPTQLRRPLTVVGSGRLLAACPQRLAIHPFRPLRKIRG